MSDQGAEAGISLYLDLLKGCLTREISGERYVPLRRPTTTLRRWIYFPLSAMLTAQRLELVRPTEPREDIVKEGRGCPTSAETMIGRARLDSLQQCVVDVIRRNVPGDLIETGVWRGGATIFMKGVLEAYGVKDRVVWAADSFQGLPKPKPGIYPADTDDPHWTHDWLAVSLDEVRENFRRYGLLDERVKFLPGWFSETLPGAPIQGLAVLRLDGDMYESTIVALESLYPKVSPGGYVIIDDYGAVAACKQAVDEFRSTHEVTEELKEIDWTGRFWQRGR